MALVTILCLVQFVLAMANLFMLMKAGRRLTEIREAERKLAALADRAPRRRTLPVWPDGRGPGLPERSR